jgi:hypothetical protein
VPASLVSQLQVAAHTTHVSNVVATPNGYEAATWAFGRSRVIDRGTRYQHRETLIGHIYFWRAGPTDGWARVGASTYPAFASAPYPCRPTIRAGQVAGGDDAVFIVDACITGDGVVNAVAFANGRDGWGSLETTPDGALVSLGRGTVVRQGHIRPTSAAKFDMRFDGRSLVTVDRTWYFADAGDGLYPRVTDWQWQGEQLRAIRSNPFIAARVGAPDFSAAPMPKTGCPRNGTFTAVFGPRYRWVRVGANAPLDLYVAPPAGGRRPMCRQLIAAKTPMTVQAGHSDSPYALRPRPLASRMWVTAPVWMLLISQLGFSEGQRVPLFVGPVARETSPYVVPASIRVNEMRVRLGAFVPHHHAVAVRALTHGTVTFRDGRIVGLAVRP